MDQRILGNVSRRLGEWLKNVLGELGDKITIKLTLIFVIITSSCVWIFKSVA